MTTIITKNSSTASAVPLAADLVQGELAVNVTDKRLFTQNASDVVVELGTNPSTITTTTVNGLTVGKGAGSVATNTAVGVSALAANTTGDSLVAVGLYSLASNTSGNYNSAVGRGALTSNTTGSSNVGVGMQALASNTTASNNTAVGYQAGYTNTTGAGNAYFGQGAGYVNTGGANTFIGTASGNAMTTGNYNTVLGSFSGNQGGLDIRTASNYIVLSDGAGNPRGYFDANGTYIIPKGNGGNTTGAANAAIYLSTDESTIQGTGTYTQIRMGGNLLLRGTGAVTCQTNNSGGVNLSSGATSWAAVSDERLKDLIEPITNATSKIDTLRAVIGKYKTDEDGVRRSFLVAQDVQTVLPEAVDVADDEQKTLSVKYTEVIPLLVAAIKELNAKVDAQAAEIAALKGAA